MYLDYVEADVLVEGKESNNSQTVVVPHSMHQEKLNQEPKLREWGMGNGEWEKLSKTTKTHSHLQVHVPEQWHSQKPE